MKKFLWFPLVALLAFAVAFSFSQQAQASEVPHHWHIKVIPHTPHSETGEENPDIGGAPAAGLYGVGQAFVVTPLQQPGNTGTAAAELWPCAGGEGTAQPDCAYIGSTGTNDPPSLPYSWVLGNPAYVWYLSADTTNAPWQPYGCDASTTADATNYRGQTNTWYEDWSGDSTDQLIYTLEATQDGSVVADSGTVDFGPNSFGGLIPAVDVVVYGDQNFGTDGVATGPNNGNCEAAYNYPLAAPAYPGVYIVPANKTCVDPVASSSIGKAVTDEEIKLSPTTEIGTPVYTKKTSGTLDGVTCSKTAPCYEVKWTSKYKLSQSWYIWVR